MNPLICGVVGLALMLAGGCGDGGDVPSSRDVVVSPRDRPVAGYYLGVLEGTEPRRIFRSLMYPGREAWLLHLETGPARGSLYLRPEFAEVCEWSLDSAGVLNFRTGLVREEGVRYTFTGRREADGIRGDLQRWAEGREENSMPVVFRPLATAVDSVERIPRWTGVYSSLSFDRASGRVSGAELIVLPGLQDVMLVFTYTGPSERSRRGPYVASSVSVAGDTVRFAVVARDSVVSHYVGVFGETAVVLQEESRPFTTDLAVSGALTKQFTLPEFFGQEKVGEC